MRPRTYIGLRGCIPTVGVGCLATFIGYAALAALAARWVRR